MGSLPLMRHADRAASSGKGHAGVLFNIIHGREGDCKGEDGDFVQPAPDGRSGDKRGGADNQVLFPPQGVGSHGACPSHYRTLKEPANLKKVKASLRLPDQEIAVLSTTINLPDSDSVPGVGEACGGDGPFSGPGFTAAVFLGDDAAL